jgi:tetratricopeptide (TPR) repeat protein
VLLYELLTGTRPFSPQPGATPPALERDPLPPSVTVTRDRSAAADRSTGGRRTLPAPPPTGRATLRRTLAGDLDNIVLRAMHREPARRYATVEKLIADVRRYLDGYPVMARPDSWSYRATKFLRRNRLAVAAGGALTLALVAGLGVSLWQGGIARTERGRAERRLRDVHELSRAMLFDVQDAIEDLPGASQARALLVGKAADYLRRLAAESERDTSILRDLAEAYERLGGLQGRRMQQGIGKEDAALESYREAVRLRGEVAAMRPEDLEAQRAHAAALHGLAAFMIEHQMPREALEVQGRAIEAQLRLVALQPADTILALNAMIMRNNYARALVHAGRFDEGLPLARRGLEDLPPHVAAHPNDVRLPALLADFHLQYGYLLALASAAPDSARHHLMTALTLLDGALRDRPGHAGLRLNLAAATGTLSLVEMFGFQRVDSAMRYSPAAGKPSRRSFGTTPATRRSRIRWRWRACKRRCLPPAPAISCEPSACVRRAHASWPAGAVTRRCATGWTLRKRASG